MKTREQLIDEMGQLYRYLNGLRHDSHNCLTGAMAYIEM